MTAKEEIPMIPEVNIKMFNKDGRDDYGYRHYLKVRKYSKKQLNRIVDLRNHLNEIILYKRGNKWIEFLLVAVTLPNKNYSVLKDRYKGYPYDFRLNYPDYKTNTKRMWDGFWTNNIDKLKLKK